MNEIVRRRNRREVFAPKIFEKRLEAYEGLFERVHASDKELSELLAGDSLTKEEAHAHVSKLVFHVAYYVEDHRLYLDDDLRGHCVAVFVSAEDLLLARGKKREELQRSYSDMLNHAYKMISEDSGIAEVTKLFKLINRPKMSGPFIEAVQRLRREKRP